MKYIYSILLPFALLFSIKGQQRKISGYIIDSENNEALPYSNIMVLGYPLGTTSDLKGYFELIIHDSIHSDTLVVSYIGYETKKYPIKVKIKNDIRLTPLKIQFKEVVIKPTSKNPKTIELNKFKKKDTFLQYSKSPFDSLGNMHIPYRPTEPTIQAIYNPFTPKYSEFIKVSRLKMYVKSYVDSSLFRLRIFKPDSKNYPGEDLLLNSYEVNVQMGQELIDIDLSNENIVMPESGLFVGIELLIIPKNKSEISNEQGKIATSYSPFLYNLFDKGKNNTKTYFYSKGKWSLSKYWYFNQGVWFESENPNIMDKKVAGPYLIKPAVSLILSEF